MTTSGKHIRCMITLAFANSLRLLRRQMREEDMFGTIRSGIEHSFSTVHARPSRSALIVFSLMFMSLAWLSSPSKMAFGKKIEELPVQKAAPATVVIQTPGTEAELRHQMRVKNGVAELPIGRGRFSEVPVGSYGFIAPTQLGLALVTQSSDLVLERSAATIGNDYEIHKLSDGSGLLVGFMGRERLEDVIPSERLKNVRVSLYSNVSDAAPIIVALPVVKLMVDRMPTRTDSTKRDSAVVLEMDLQNTINRKSPVGH